MAPSSAGLDMSQPESHPTTAEWNRWKDEIERLYLHSNWTLPQVQQHLGTSGFEATERQYKLRLKAWGFVKKIRGDVWSAMWVVFHHLRFHDRKVPFSVPVRGNAIRHITPEMISKQMRRIKVALPDRDTAIQILVHNNVWISPNDGFKESGQLPSLDSVVDGDQNPSCALGEVNASPEEPQLTSAAVTDPYPAREMPEPTFDLDQSETEQDVSVAGSLEHIHTDQPFVMTKTRDALPDQHVSQYPAGCAAKCMTDDFDIVSAFGHLSLDPNCQASIRLLLRKYVIHATSLQVLRPVNHEKLIAVQWTAYYVVKSLPEKCKYQTAKVEHGTRQDAMSAFRVMIDHLSQSVFPYCNWMIAVLGSNSGRELIIEFLSDCCEVLDNSHPEGQELNYGSPFRLALALCTENQRDLEHYGKKLESSHTLMRMIWGEDSPNYLISQYHYAWHKLQDKQYQTAIDIASKCFPMAERIMGYSHTATVSCLAILSRAYDGIARTAEAIQHLEAAVHRLADAPKCLQTFRHRLMLRLALLFSKSGSLARAEMILKEVLEFRLDWFGIKREETWNVIRKLYDVLKQEGNQEEADQLDSQMDEMFTRESSQPLESANAGHEEQGSQRHGVYRSSEYQPHPLTPSVIPSPSSINQTRHTMGSGSLRTSF